MNIMIILPVFCGILASVTSANLGDFQEHQGQGQEPMWIGEGRAVAGPAVQATCEDVAGRETFCSTKCNTSEKCDTNRKCKKRCPKTCNLCTTSPTTTTFPPPTPIPSPRSTCPPSTPPPSETSCKELLENGENQSGLYIIKIGTLFKCVYCDMETDGGGWTVIQRRGDFGNPVDYFLKKWDDYRYGFGDPNEDFWFGLEYIHQLGKDKEQQLLIELQDFGYGKASTLIDNFQVGDEASNYTLSRGEASNELGECFPASGLQFSTIDRDHDTSSENCAEMYSAAWWYTNCHCSNPNGLYLRGQHDSYANGVNWFNYRGHYYSLKDTEMKVRATD